MAIGSMSKLLAVLAASMIVAVVVANCGGSVSFHQEVGGGGEGAGGCTTCDNGEKCHEAADCKSGYCVDDVCCDDVCGGDCETCNAPGKPGTCTPLAQGTACRDVAGDCDVAEACDGKSGDCPADGHKADGEPSAGGGCAPYLCNGKAASCPLSCADDADCIPDNLCLGSVCAPKTCADQVKNGDETDVDCGGPSCPKCAECTACLGGDDCAGGVCAQGLCQAAVVEIAAGGWKTCARKSDGTLWCWGDNGGGQLGNGTPGPPEPLPVQATALGGSVVQVAVGGAHTCACKSDGTLWCWGYNGYGVLGVGTSDSPMPSPVQVTALGTDAVEVAASGTHTCARKADGTIWCWGKNDDGEIGDGTLDSPKLSPVQVSALGAAAVEVTAGGQHSCASLADGTAWCWGHNGAGQLGNGTALWEPSSSLVQVKALGPPFVELSASVFFTCGRKSDGTLWCWGDNVYGQIAHEQTGVPQYSPAQVKAMGTSALGVASGRFHACAHKSDGTLWCWGKNEDGQIGVGDTGWAKPSPVPVTALGADVVEVAAGVAHTCARKGDGTVWCWGMNSSGQLGDGTTDSPKPSPVKVGLGCP